MTSTKTLQSQSSRLTQSEFRTALSHMTDVSPLASAMPEENTMSAHLLTLYPAPMDRAIFEHQYRHEYLPYAQANLIGASHFRTKRTIGPGTPPFHLISEVVFPTPVELLACALSVGGQRTFARSELISNGRTPLILAAVEDECPIGGEKNG